MSKADEIINDIDNAIRIILKGSTTEPIKDSIEKLIQLKTKMFRNEAIRQKKATDNARGQAIFTGNLPKYK